jgi:hypothetical protein
VISRLAITAVVAATLAACNASVPASGFLDAPSGGPGDAGGNDDGAHSGTRLKLTHWTFADGTTTWNAFYDQQRREACQIAQWADGNLYCVPNNWASVVYADAACTQKLGQMFSDPSCPLPAAGYALDFADDGCSSSPNHLYVRGAPLPVPSTFYTLDSTGACSGNSDDGTNTYYGVGAEVPISQLVQLTLGLGSGKGAFATEYATSSDGAQFPWAVRDHANNLSCQPAVITTDTSTATCAPTSWFAGYDHDAACTIPEMALPKTCAAFQYAQHVPPNSCASDPAVYYPVGASEASSPLFAWTGTSCGSATADATLSYFAVGSPLALAPFARSPDHVPSRRVQLIHMVPPDGSVRVRDPSLWDSQLDAECYPTDLPDGTNRCVPFGGNVSTYYSDPQCTQSIDVVELFGNGSGCAPPVVPKYAQKFVGSASNLCSYTYEVHPLTTVYTGALYFESSSCMAYTPSDEVIYTIGPALDPTTFALATSVTSQ